MLITEILKQGFRVSVELVPSMINREGHPSLTETLKTLDEKIKPSFISVTQGTTPASREQSPHLLNQLTARERCAHLICGYTPKDEVLRHAANFYAQGIRNFLVLKGDAPKILNGTEAHQATPTPEYKTATECISDLKAKYSDVCLGAAAYPDADDENERINYLRLKQDAGAEFAITQMLFDPNTYTKFIEDLALPNFPVLPGVCYIHDTQHAQAFAKRFNVKIPIPTPSPTKLIEDFKKAGAPGVHLFLLNDLLLLKNS